MSLLPIEITRAKLEAKIEELIALLDFLDGDENLEPYLADTHPVSNDREDDDEREPEETDENGDELDYTLSEDEWSRFIDCDVATDVQMRGAH